MKVKVMMLRRNEEAPSWMEEKDALAVYQEFLELWEKDDGDFEGNTKRRIAQWNTGRKLSFIDHVTPEFLEEWGIQIDSPLPGTHHVLDHVDFTVYRFKIV